MRVPLQFGSGFRRFTKHIKKKRRPPTAATVTLSTDGEFDDVALCDRYLWICLDSLLNFSPLSVHQTRQRQLRGQGVGQRVHPVGRRNRRRQHQRRGESAAAQQPRNQER